MDKYNITGMSCAAVRMCRKGSEVSGYPSVSLLTNSMGVEGSASRKPSKAVEDADMVQLCKAQRRTNLCKFSSKPKRRLLRIRKALS